MLACGLNPETGLRIGDGAHVVLGVHDHAVLTAIGFRAHIAAGVTGGNQCAALVDADEVTLAQYDTGCYRVTFGATPNRQPGGRIRNRHEGTELIASIGRRGSVTPTVNAISRAAKVVELVETRNSSET